jgi:6-phosphogluconate dehydrogenase
MNEQNLIIYLIGVSAVGKTSIGKSLSETLNLPFFDADDYHPQSNKQKMASGSPLTDEDRQGWLHGINELAIEQIKEKGCIIACSALKKSYRKTLQKGVESQVKWIFLDGDMDLLKKRLTDRKDHFMPVSLLQSQFETLEKPEDAFRVSVDQSPKQILDLIISELHKSEFGLVGLGVMGKSLSRNIASKGFKISVFNRHVPEKEENVAVNFQKEFQELTDAKPFDELETFVKSLQRPRKIFLMINAGNAIEQVTDQLLPFLGPGDVIMDGGNSHYLDTERRIKNLNEQGIHFLGVGVSGGEEGALKGPAIMPGGNTEAYTAVANILESIAAKDATGKACCAYVGKGGSGHFVKMVHNGIEYSEMQLLAEVYQILSLGLNLQNSVIADLLKSWEKTESDSYLLEITIDILNRKENDKYLLDEVLDKAGNKGTGNWTTVAASQLGVPVSVLTSALYARYISAFKELRTEASKVFQSKDISTIEIDLETIRKGYHLARLINHHQGIHLLCEASKAYDWDLNLSEIARIWTNGCIIRSKLMEKLKIYLKNNNQLLLNDEVIKFANNSKVNLKELVQKAIQKDVPVSCLSEALNYLNAFSQKESGANLIQAQRDYFGAHLYQRKNDPSGNWYHTDWDPGHNS